MENLTVTGLVRLIGAGATMIYVVTDNERRTEHIATQTAARLKGAGYPYVWTCTEGFSRDGAVVEGIDDPVAAVGFALAQPGPLLFLFKDLPWFWGDNPYLIRALKDFAMRAKAKAIVVLGQQEGIPAALREEFVILQQGLPAMEEIKAFFEQARARDPQLAQACQERPGLLDDLVVAAQGLDLLDVERGMRGARAAGEAGGEGLVRSIFETKRAIIRTGGIMEFVVNDVTPDQVGGMENLKQWMARREQAFGLEGISSGANLPKGVLMMGIAGCGKSLFVKAIAATWRLPLIRLDMAAVYDGSYGTPESSLRKAFRTAEAVAPCVLWIDEIEAGISTQGFKAEGGPASRILGSFLTWMQEKRAPVFVAATANAIEMLPAEIIRKGRFDEIFYIGLPETKGREEIFRIHLTRRKVDLSAFDVPLLAGSTKGFSGAEIEQAVQAAAFEALTAKRPMTQQDLMAAISRTVPLSVTMAEQIKKIEAWAFKRAVPA
ncbi:AAA family ATPase [Geobacter grbiciae]|uniref:AAA family ATPase n=1 Tax=Geobacter grbiciae TaxID=155042 RepID=UPI001C034F4C|nr:AAA family ATPase [Geobacter grbiciae]